MNERIVFENNDVIVYNKVAGEDSEKLSEVFGREVYVINRLDKPVAGLICLAKNSSAASFLNSQIQNRTFSKTYYAIIPGTMDTEGVLVDLLLHDKRSNKSFVVKRERKGVKEASLEYKVESVFERANEKYSLLKIKLHTGRTHQIRVQFASRKHPLVGDGKYGSRVKCNIRLLSCDIGFVLPGEKEQKHYSVEPDEAFRIF